MEATDVGRYGTLSLLSPASATITSFGIDTAPLTFGSDPKSTVRLFYPTIAPTHALVEFIDSKAYLVVLGKTGVEVDGCRLREGARVALGNGDEFMMQGKKFRFEYPPKAMRKFMDGASPVKASGRRVRLSMVRAAVIDSPTPGGKIIQLGHGEVMLREEGLPDMLERHDAPFASPSKGSHAANNADATSIYPSLPLPPPSPSKIQRPPSPQKDSLRGRVLLRSAFLAEEEQEEMEVAGGLITPSDTESDASSDSGSQDGDMMVDSEPEIMPDSEVEQHDESDFWRDDEVMEIPTPKPFKFTRLSMGPGRQSLGGGPPVRPERPSFKLDLSVPSFATPIKEEDVNPKEMFTTPRRKKAPISDAEKKAIQERRKSALVTPDVFFAGRVPGLGPPSPTKLFGVKEEQSNSSIFGSPVRSSAKASPRKTISSPSKASRGEAPFAKPRSSIFTPSPAAVTEESDEDDAEILLAKMRDTMETMRARMSPKKEDSTVEIPRPRLIDIVAEPTPSTPLRRSVSPSKVPGRATSPAKVIERRSVSPVKDQNMQSPAQDATRSRSASPVNESNVVGSLSPVLPVEGQVMQSPTKTAPRSRSTPPLKDNADRSQLPMPALDLRRLLSPRKSRTASPAPPDQNPMDVDEATQGEASGSAELAVGEPVPAEMVAEEPAQDEGTSEPVSEDEPPIQSKTKTRSATMARGAELEIEPPRRALRGKKAPTPSPEGQDAEPPKCKITKGKRVASPPTEEEAPRTRATRAKRAPTPFAEEPLRVTRGKRAPTPTAEGTRTKTRAKTEEIENEDPEPKLKRRTRSKTESDVEVSDAEEGKSKGRKPRTRTRTEPIPEVVEEEQEVVKTNTRSRTKAVKQEDQEEAVVPRTRTRTRTRTAGAKV